MRKERPLAYDIKDTPGPTRIVHEAVFACHGCGTRAVLNIGEQHNPEKIAKRLKQHGWRGSAWCPRRDVMCPKCIAAESANDTMSELRKFMDKRAHHVAQTVVGTPELAEIASTPVVLSMETMTIHEKENTDMPKGYPNAKPSGENMPSSDARMLIRQKLDTHFDDKAGVFLAGMSDEKIATELGFPRKWVSDIREAAYGSLRENPIVSQLKSEIDGLRTEIADQAGKYADFMERTGRRLAELTDKVEAFGRSVKS